MLQTLEGSQPLVIDRIEPADIRRALLADDSPFGIQGLARDSLKILKPGCINALAATLALRGTPEQIRDPQFVAKMLDRHEEWQNEFRVVHLIEKSLWIDGHSDLVMTMVKNPSRILDNPPREILDAMSLAISVHPQSTIWYGVPLFSDETNADGLPIPLTAAEVRAEATRRVQAAQQQAVRWQWIYRAVFKVCRTPMQLVRSLIQIRQRVHQSGQNVAKYWKRVRCDLRNRRRARILAQSEFYKTGRAVRITPIPSTLVGRVTARTADSIESLNEMVAYRVSLLESVLPLPISPMTIMECDPFLFVELPHEPNRLRFLGHWYWQGQPRGEAKLHLHAPL